MPPRSNSEATVRRIAVAMPSIARSGDHAAADALLGMLEGRDQFRLLVMMLAARCDLEAARCPAGDKTRRMHSIFVRLRSEGIPPDDMPAAVRRGESEYQSEMWLAGSRARQRRAGE